MDKKYKSMILLVLFFVACMGTSFYFSRYKLVVYPVGGASMEPTVHHKDRVVVYRTKNIKHGDIIVFYSEALNKNLIKRVIGLGGDQIEIKYNQDANAYDVYRNDELLVEDYLDELIQNNYHEFQITVPEGKIFFLGDNRNSSTDSHSYEEMADISLVAGRVFFRYNSKSIGFLEIAV